MSNLSTLIKLALKEDIGSGDVTSNAIVPKYLHATAKIVAKEDMILAGVSVAVEVFKAIDKAIKIKIKKKDGEAIKKGATIAEVRGRARNLLAGERTALNFLQHLSGIATTTHKFVKITKFRKFFGVPSKGVGLLLGEPVILDTRKTLPGLRELEKYAVKMGGGVNHRMGLYDMYLIKNNHVDIAGSVAEAIRRIRSRKQEAGSMKKTRRSQLKLEVEVRNMREFQEAIAGGADIIMSDNFSLKTAKKAILLAKKSKKRPKIEISGQISLKNIKKYAKLGADYISIGAITHSAPAADIHMKITFNGGG